MQVVVLAGGIGSRLRPWTNDIPKPLLPMLDATLLERVVEGVPSDLVDEVIVAGGYKVDMIRDYFRKADVDFDVRIVPEDEPLGTGGALGNIFDRIVYKSVPDFIDFHFNGFHWFIFNIADIFITIGVICLIYDEIFIEKKENV